MYFAEIGGDIVEFGMGDFIFFGFGQETMCPGHYILDWAGVEGSSESVFESLHTEDYNRV